VKGLDEIFVQNFLPLTRRDGLQVRVSTTLSVEGLKGGAYAVHVHGLVDI
jgi:hypothetical protein